MNARLLQLVPPVEFVVDEGGTLIGRGAASAIRLDDLSVSREHARILRQGTHWQLLDLGSANGTLVNGMPVKGMAVLQDGDLLRMGKHIFRFSCGIEEKSRDATSLSGATFLDEPETREVVLLVADLKGFTPLSSRLPPAVLAAAVRHWCEECQAILEGHGARLDKFIGDSAFAWWPGREATAHRLALGAAEALLTIKPPGEAVRLECGVALHSGEAALCYLPDSSFTLLGSAVNTTFRMEALTRVLGVPLLVSQTFVDGCGEMPFRFHDCGSHYLKGLAEPVQVHAVPGLHTLPES